jgi:hypothetical protein
MKHFIVNHQIGTFATFIEAPVAFKNHLLLQIIQFQVVFNFLQSGFVSARKAGATHANNDFVLFHY